MKDCKNLTVEGYKKIIDQWFIESRTLPINQWSIFNRARRWLW